MFNKLKMLWNLLFNSKQLPPTEQEVHPLPTEVVESKPVVVKPEPVAVKSEPVIKAVPPEVTPEINWPFPNTRPQEVVKKPIQRKRKAIPKSDAVPVVKKTAKQIAADRRKAAADKDRGRTKGKK